MTQSERSKVPNLRQASRMVFTSAWAVGSLSMVTLLERPAMISPSFTMTAPKGPPPFFTLSSARRMASRMYSLSCSVICIVVCLKAGTDVACLLVCRPYGTNLLPVPCLQFRSVLFRYLSCQSHAVALRLGAEGAEAFAPPLAFVFADAVVVGFFIERLA